LIEGFVALLIIHKDPVRHNRETQVKDLEVERDQYCLDNREDHYNKGQEGHLVEILKVGVCRLIMGDR
jgi:hypothetical protein